MLTVIPTIDTEGVHGTRPFQQMVLGQIDSSDEQWGVFHLTEIFRRYNASATFFVDVYEYSLWGKESLREVCEKLTDLGFDVQLHTHPAWRDDPHDFRWLRDKKRNMSFMSQDKDFMAKLDLQEQIDVLAHGMELIQEWTGKAPVAHRSGGYSINQTTIEALRHVGIQLDSSMHWGHPHSRLAWTRNQVVEREGVVELPVTLIDYVFSLPVAGSIYRKSMKTDLDTCSLRELMAYVEQAKKHGIKVMNLFMHSYSLLDFDQNYKRFKPEFSDIKKLSDFLSIISTDDDVRILSCSEFLDEYRKSPDKFSSADIVPEVVVNSKIARLALAKITNNVNHAFRRYISLH